MIRLYFYTGRPTEAQRQESESLGALLRDSRAVRQPPYKPCDEAYGDVPEPYLAYKVQAEAPAEPEVVPEVKPKPKRTYKRKKG